MAGNTTNNTVNSNKQSVDAPLNEGSRIEQSGLGNNLINEQRVLYITAQNETVINGATNSFIILGNDRPASRTSGHGGKGATNCSTIDLVVGVSSGRQSPPKDKDGNIAHSDKSFILDAARIYISEMTDVDDNFGLVDGGVGKSKGKSAIALKADGLRFIARDGIKLVTKTDLKNSKDKEVVEHAGIDLIANNDDASLQPMVLGTNMIECVNALIDELDNVQNRIQSFIDQQSKYNAKIAKHTHYSPFFGIPNTLDPSLAVQNGSMTISNLLNVEAPYYFQKVNFIGLKQTYLENGEKSITSKYNRVN